ncbi:MAG: acyl carrier protein [Planctomycetaceae bacterium]
MKPSASIAVAEAIANVLRDTGRDVRRIEPHMLLAGDVGLDSLDLAQTIVLLERSLGIDPFRSAGAAGKPLRTVADLVAVYEAALATP